ncbi:MAG: hypothetical protein RLZZ549_1005, partial [Pseudomonadota bacterium]
LGLESGILGPGRFHPGPPRFYKPPSGGFYLFTPFASKLMH